MVGTATVVLKIRMSPSARPLSVVLGGRLVPSVAPVGVSSTPGQEDMQDSARVGSAASSQFSCRDSRPHPVIHTSRFARLCAKGTVAVNPQVVETLHFNKLLYAIKVLLFFLSAKRYGDLRFTDGDD